jgi:hypothetical protein
LDDPLAVSEKADAEAAAFLDDERTPEEQAAEVRVGPKIDPDIKFLNGIEVLVKRDIKAAANDIRVRQTGVKLLLEIRKQRAEKIELSKKKRSSPFNDTVLRVLGLALTERAGGAGVGPD